jgi:uncharacterized protein
MTTALLRAGAEANGVDGAGRTPAMYTADAQTLQTLVDAGADVHACDASGLTALMAAAERGDVDAIRYLLRHAVGVHAATTRGETAWHHALLHPRFHARRESVHLLTAAGAQADEETIDGITPLMFAVAQADDELARDLMALGADPAGRRASAARRSRSQAMPSAQRARMDFTRGDRLQRCIANLLAGGAPVDEADEEGSTALHYAAMGFDAALVRLLVEAGANLETRNADGLTPLMVAVTRGSD